MNRLTTATIGAAGEYYVAAYLSRKELVVALPRAGVSGTDLFVSASNSGHPIRLQVKTGTQSISNDKNKGPIYLWAASVGIADLIDDRKWFAFVWLKNWPEDLPEVFFVPLAVVSACMDQQRESSYPSFWMRSEDAEQYKGNKGYQKLRDALTDETTSSAKDRPPLP